MVRKTSWLGAGKLEANNALLGLLLIAPTVLIFAAVIVYPLVSAIYLSVFSIYTPTMEGDFVALDNYRRLLASGEFWRSLFNNAVWTIGTLTLQIVFGVLVALIAAPEYGVQSVGKKSRPVSVFPVDRSRRAGMEVAIQRPLRDSQSSTNVAAHCRHAGRLARLDAERDDQSDFRRCLEILSIRRHSGAGATANDPTGTL